VVVGTVVVVVDVDVVVVVLGAVVVVVVEAVVVVDVEVDGEIVEVVELVGASVSRDVVSCPESSQPAATTITAAARTAMRCSVTMASSRRWKDSARIRR